MKRWILFQGRKPSVVHALRVAYIYMLPLLRAISPCIEQGFPFKRCLKCCIACNLSSAHVFPPHYCNKGIARRISSSLEESFHGYFVSLSYDALVPGRENIHLRNYWKANKKSTINFAEFNEIDNAWKSGNFLIFLNLSICLYDRKNRCQILSRSRNFVMANSSGHYLANYPSRLWLARFDI